MAKAEAVGIRFMVNVPFSITSPHLRRHLGASLSVDDKGAPFLHLRKLIVCPKTSKGTSLTMFAAEISRLRHCKAVSSHPGWWLEVTQLGHPLATDPK